MKEYLLLLLLSFSSVAGFGQSQPAAAKTYALVIGISGYQDAAIPALNYADKDASLFAQWLQTKAGGSVPGYHIKLLTNENASIAAVYTALDWLKETATAGDTVFIYFSGHGDIETKDSMSLGYLLAWNSPPYNYRNNSVSVEDLNNIANTLTTSNKANVIIITDACHSGKMAGDFYKGRELTATNLRLVLNNQVRLASCRADEKAAEGPNWGGGRGVFSYYLLMGLNGKASNNGMVKLQDLQEFLNSALSADKYLKLDNHAQHPVTDGNPLFPMANIDTAFFRLLAAQQNEAVLAKPATAAGLQSLKAIGRQPIDYFFEMAEGSWLDTVLSYQQFQQYQTMVANDVPAKMVTDIIEHLDDSKRKADSLNLLSMALRELLSKNQSASDSIQPIIDNTEALSQNYFEQYRKDLQDTLLIFSNQLTHNKFLRARFIEKFVQLTHQKTQDIINAYLKGDVVELEKRQYYYTGNRNYRNFLQIIETALHLAPESNYLHGILKINQAYIAGLVDRLDITLSPQRADSLLGTAMAKLQRALSLEPYAAYIHNEVGNLYMQQKNYDSASYHFNYALLLSPTWAIPWSNKIRMNLAMGNLDKAKEAISKADSLQPNLAYVNVNAGLVMEKDNNLLAAEGYYLAAISQNNVHYLPYERLGKMYILTGNYEKADSFLYEAKRRKDEFAVNEYVFDFGIEAGAPGDISKLENLMYDCDLSKDSLVAGWETYNRLVRALFDLRFNTDKNKDGVQLANEVLQQHPNMPLLHHYLGIKYREESKWQLAIAAFKQAKIYYQPRNQLRNFFKSALLDSLRSHLKSDENSLLALVNNSCLPNMIMNFSYDAEEDNYLLAGIYEKNDFIDDAIEEYKIAASLENLRQMEQAVLKNSPGNEAVQDVMKDFKGSEEEYEQTLLGHAALVAKYNSPIRMGGSLKAAGLYEQSGKFELAEEILLKQVLLNQQAGYARQEEMNKGNFGPTGESTLNYYWLDVNRDLEAATYNFYSRMLAQFPRDAYWYTQAGMSLYKRLALTYLQIPVAERPTFYRYSLRYAYPFEGSLQPPNDGLDYEDVYRRLQTKSYLPGTGELLVVDLFTYDPVKNAQTYLQQAIRFSGETNPDALLLEAMADLQSWMGNHHQAIDNYKLLATQQPGNASLRNKLIEQLLIAKRFPQAAANLDSLFIQSQISRSQLLQLADYKLLSRNYTGSATILSKYVPVSQAEKNIIARLQAKKYMLMGEPAKALVYLSNITAPDSTGAEEDPRESEAQANQYYLDDYTSARLRALRGENGKALKALQSLIDSGFDYQYVLSKDPAWDRLRTTKKWKTLLAAHKFENIYIKAESNLEESNTTTVSYRIPRLNK